MNNMGSRIMKRIFVVGGSMVVGIILVLAMLTTSVSAQTVKSDEVQANIFQNIKNKISNNIWFPGEFLGILLYILIVLIVQFSLNHPPSS